MAREFRNTAVQLISASSGTGASSGSGIGAASRFTMQIALATGTTGAGTVALEGSLNGSNWNTIISSTYAANTVVSSTTSDIYTQIRANVTAHTAGGPISVWAVGMPG